MLLMFMLFIVFIIKNKEHGGTLFLDWESLRTPVPETINTETSPKAATTKRLVEDIVDRLYWAADNLNKKLITRMRYRCADTQSCYKKVCLFLGKTGKSICQNKDDETVANVIKKVYLDFPSNKKYKFKVNPPKLKGQIGVPNVVDKILLGKKNGFFIESGAYNGEEISNSLFFEMKRNFTGLLVEPNRFNYKKLLGVNRKAFSINACYSTSDLPMVVEFVNADAMGAIKHFYPKAKLMQKQQKHTQWFTYQGESKALCLSFYSVLLAVGNPVVDYFSLDIEGAELPVLKTIPWDKVDIKVLSIECQRQISRCNQIATFMNTVGYKLVYHIPSKSDPQDLIFVKK